MSVGLLFEWMSELGHGRWDSYKRAHDWMLNSGETGGQTVWASATMHTLATLAHAEADWSAGTWAVCPPVLTILPNGGAQAILVGARTRGLVAHLRALALDESTDLWVEECPQPSAPTAVFVTGRDERDMKDVALALNIAYELCAGERLAAMLPTMDEMLLACRSTQAPRGYDVDRYDGRRKRFEPATDDSSPGLYRYTVWQRREYRFVSPDRDWHAVDYSTGVYAELRRVGEDVLGYQAQEVNGTLRVPAYIRLPALHARAAVLCTGLVPALSRDSHTYLHYNVPRETAAAIAGSLGQNLMGG